MGQPPGHDSLFSTQDAHGPLRRGILLASCDALGILDNLSGNKVLSTIISLTNFPQTNRVCSNGQPIVKAP